MVAASKCRTTASAFDRHSLDDDPKRSSGDPFSAVSQVVPRNSDNFEAGGRFCLDGLVVPGSIEAFELPAGVQVLIQDRKDAVDEYAPRLARSALLCLRNMARVSRCEHVRSDFCLFPLAFALRTDCFVDAHDVYLRPRSCAECPV
mgnify:CR=1 FL=1